MKPRIDLAGKRFGKLLVLREHPEPYRSPSGKATRRWVCRCDCGREIIVLQNALTAKHKPTQSCGCSRAETMRSKAAPVVGKRFGRLVVISECSFLEPVAKTRRGLVCRCDCGNEIVTTHKHLTEGKRSCGCLLADTARRKVASGVTGHVNGTNLPAIRDGRGANRNSKSGVLGVYYSESEECWIAKIGVRGKSITLGRFATREEAAAARKIGEEEYFGPLRRMKNAEEPEKDH